MEKKRAAQVYVNSLDPARGSHVQSQVQIQSLGSRSVAEEQGK